MDIEQVWQKVLDAVEYEDSPRGFISSLYSTEWYLNPLGSAYILREPFVDQTFPTHEQAEYVISKIRKFYESVTPEELAALNNYEPEIKPVSYEGAISMPTQKREYPSNTGFIYLLRAVTPFNHYKIGLSKNPDIRIKTLGVQLPFPIEPIHIIDTDQMNRAEQHLHEKYRSCRVGGEWFELSDDQVAEICSIESMMFGGAA